MKPWTASLTELAGVVALGVLSAWPRFVAPDVVPFGYDEALEALRARAIALGARPVTNEVTSWLLPDPALMLYVYALAEAAADPAIARTWLLGALNTIAVLLTYAWARSVGGVHLGAVSAVLYAVSPWAIFFGRQPWVNAQPVLTSLMLLSATMVISHQRRAWSLPFFIALGLQMQTHLLGMVLVVPAALTVLIFWRRWGWTILPGSVVLLLVNAPFGIHVWDQRESVLQTFSSPSTQVAVNHPFTALRLAARFLGGAGIESKLVEGAELFQSMAPLQMVVSALLLTMFLAGTGLAAHAAWRRTFGWQGYVIALLWCFTPLAAAMAQSRPVYIHYMTAIIPACFILAALPFTWLAQRHRAGLLVSATVILGIAGAHLALFAFLLRGADYESNLPPRPIAAAQYQAQVNEIQRGTRADGIGDLFGPSLQYWRRLATGIRAAAEQEGVRTITVLTGLSDPYELYVDRRRMALDYLLGPSIMARFPFEGTVVLPLGATGLLLQLPGVEVPRQVRNPEPRFELPVPGTEDVTRLLAVSPRERREQPQGRRRVRADFELGAQLVSYDAPQRLEPGEQLALSTYWTFEGLSDEARQREYSVFIHLVDEEGTIVAQSDGLGLTSHAWRSGDLLIRRVTLPTPSSPTRLTPTVGVYEVASLERVPVQLEQGVRDDRVQLGPVSIR